MMLQTILSCAFSVTSGSERGIKRGRGGIEHPGPPSESGVRRHPARKCGLMGGTS